MVSPVGKFSVRRAAAAASNVMELRLKATQVNQSFTLPTLNTNSWGNPNCVINWGDGTADTTLTDGTSASRTHAYTCAINDEFIVTITGTLQVFAFDGAGSKDMLKDIISLGAIGLRKFNVWGCGNFANWRNDLFLNVGSTLQNLALCFYLSGVSGTTAPANLFAGCSEVTDLSYGFYGRTHLTGQQPANLLSPCTKLTTLELFAAGCTGMSGSGFNLPSTNTLLRVDGMHLNDANLTAAGTCSTAPKVANYTDYLTGCTGLPITAIDNWITDVRSTNTATGTRTIRYQSCGPPSGGLAGQGHLDVNRGGTSLADINALIAAGFVRNGTYT